MEPFTNLSATAARRLHYTLLAAVLCAFAVVYVRTAWQSDDAYISFRTVDNFVHGYGLRWNTFERVQGFTNPLWTLLLSAFVFVTREMNVTSLVVSILVSLGAVGITLRTATRSLIGAVLGTSALFFSNAFIDYSTSGLENPLTFFLLACFIARYFQTEQTPETLFGLALIASLAMVNRMDTILFFAPTLAWRWWRARSVRGLVSMGVAFLPFVAWEVFSVIYYGFPWPNTAYAKLNTGIGAWPMIRQGLYYILGTFRFEPFTIGALLAGLVAPFVARKSSAIVLALGGWLYVIYVIRVGGDFMEGRHFAAPILLAAAMLAYVPWRAELGVSVFAAFTMLMLAMPYPAFLSPLDFGNDRWHAGFDPPHESMMDEHFIKDQRGCDYVFTGLLRFGKFNWEPDRVSDVKGVDNWVAWGKKEREDKERKVSAHGAIGWIGFYAGPDQYIVDWFALTEPLLARLPPRRIDTFIIGHFNRDIPEGYLKSIETGENVIKDPGVKAYYDKLKIITQGPLWTKERWRTIWEMNTGQYEHLLDDYRAKAPDRLKKKR